MGAKVAKTALLDLDLPEATVEVKVGIEFLLVHENTSRTNYCPDHSAVKTSMS